MFYGSSVWDPVLILAQIVTLQCLFYICFGLFLYMFMGLSPAGPLTVKYVFDYAAISVQTFRGWMVILTFLSSALAGALGLYIVVREEGASGCSSHLPSSKIKN
mmetsp:Transcript_15750/g.40150  ORF Transcript_15750/g.40150 Transcript_15750/m.40150 type:complete len:104 (+) Transcript_15750:97-408(+)